MKLVRLALCVIGVLLPTGSAFAQSGTITGTVTDAVSATPVPSPAEVQLYTASGGTGGTVNTNASGQYTFEGLPPGVYFVRVTSSPSYYSKLFDDIPCVADDCQITAGTPVTVTAGGTAVANVALHHDRIFTGIVRLASNNLPVTTGTVQVFNASGSFVRSVSTGLDGRFTVVGLTPGIYYARATFPPTTQRLGLSELYGGMLCPDFLDLTDPSYFRRVHPSCRIVSGTPISTLGPIQDIEFLLDPPATIGGHVVADDGGSPIGGIALALFSGDVEVARTHTTSEGAYVISGVYPGTYRLRTIGTGQYVDEWLGNVCVGCPGAPQTLTVTVGANITGMNFSLGVGGAIAGVMSCQGVFILQPTLSAFNASGDLVRVVDTGNIWGCSGPTPYRIDGLPSGTYYVLARDPQVIPFGTRPSGGSLVDKLYGDVICNTVDCDVRRGAPVAVTAGNTTGGIDFVMATGADGPLVSNARPLRLFDSRGVEMVGVVRTTFLGQQPAGLPPGIYYARWGNILHGGTRCADCPPTSGRPIVIRPGDVAFAFDFGLPVLGRNLSGNVSDDVPQPLSTVGVELLTDAGILAASTLSDQFGNYRFSDVLPGTYFLRTRNDRGYADEVYQDIACASCDPRQGTPIVIANADVANINLTLAVGGVISGAARDTSQNVLGNVPVSIFTSTGILAAQTMSHPSGTFRVNVPPGSYRARAEATPGHGAELFNELPCTNGACDVAAGTAITVAASTVTPNVNFTLASCSAMTMTPGLLASGVVGRPYRQVLTVTGGRAPVTFQLTAGALPSGVTMPLLGWIPEDPIRVTVIEGTPTVAGRHEFSIGAIDMDGCATARSFTLDVQECPFVLSPASATVPAAGGIVTIPIAGPPCVFQAVVNRPSWVSEFDNRPGHIELTVAANTGPAPRSASIVIGRRVFEIRQAGTSSQPPFGSFDAPIDGSQVAGSIALGGWALDDLEVVRVPIYRDPVNGEGNAQVFLGSAVFVRGARPDIARAFPTHSLNDRAGWGFLVLTNMLPNQGNGHFRIYAYADDAEGNRALLGAKTIIGVNASSVDPFGAIDTPPQGATISGTMYINFGWALTPQPKIIPFDGSTIHVIVDGVPIGHPSYNHFRADVSGLFPGLANSGGPVGYRFIDTTALAEGQHTIAWVVYDNLGAGAGIGSRYFNVANSADAQPADEGGIESGRRMESLAASRAPDESVRVIRLAQLEHLKLDLEGDLSTQECPATWAGYLSEKQTLGRLPVGATLDPNGTFFWQPGPGFIGTFDFHFVRTACDGGKRSVAITVVIRK